MIKRNFRITGGKGFQMTFQNGWTISVQWGMGNYCDNRELYPDGPWEFAEMEAGRDGSNTAEVAIWDEAGKWVRNESYMGSDEVAGFVTPDGVLELMNWAAKGGKV